MLTELLSYLPSFLVELDNVLTEWVFCAIMLVGILCALFRRATPGERRAENEGWQSPPQ